MFPLTLAPALTCCSTLSSGSARARLSALRPLASRHWGLSAAASARISDLCSVPTCERRRKPISHYAPRILKGTSPSPFHHTWRLLGSTTCHTKSIKSVSSEPRSGPSAPAVAPNSTIRGPGSGRRSAVEFASGFGPGGGGWGGGEVMAAEEGGARPHTRGPTRRTHAQTHGRRGSAWAGHLVLGAAPTAGLAQWALLRPARRAPQGGAATGPRPLWESYLSAPRAT